MISRSFCIFLFTGVLFLSRSVYSEDSITQTTPIQTQTQQTQTSSTQDEAQLRSLMDKLMSTVKTGKEVEVVALNKKLILPGYDTWFKQVFGPEAGTKLAEDYKALEKHLSKEDAVKELKMIQESGRSEIVISKLVASNDPKYYHNLILSKMVTQPNIYEVRLIKHGQPGEFFDMGFFTYVDGEFRLVGDLRAIR